MGYRLPPCIVMERGESLDEWSRRRKPDVWAAMPVRFHMKQTCFPSVTQVLAQDCKTLFATCSEGSISKGMFLQVLANVAQRLEAMHRAGYAHRDLKPANVMWLPRENQWTLIDFGCAAKVGREAPLSFTLAYAAPEVIISWTSGKKTIQATEEMDAWSLGVMVFELLTGVPAFDPFMQGREEVYSLARQSTKR